MTPVETKNTSSSRPASNRRSARRRRRWPYACALAGVGLWLAWCALTIVRAHDDVQAGRQSARELQHVGYGHLVDGDGRESVEQARDSFADAAGRLEQPGLLPLRILPVIGRQLDSTTSLSRAAVDGLDAGIEALDRLDVALGESLPAGPERPAALREVSIIAGDLGRELRTLDLGPEDGLIGRLAAARDEFAFDVDELATSSERAEVATSGLADVFDGPGRWLLLAANNAQMQNGSGMFLSYSVMHVADGDIVMDAVERTELLRPSHKVELDPDQASTWPWMDPNADFRHLGTSSRFDATAEEAAALFAAAGGGEVDGVLAVDAFAVRSLLEITGPIEVDGDAVGADDVVQELLHDQYVVFAETGATDRAQSARRDRLGEVASGALDALANASEIDVEDYDVLAAAAGGRHLMVWSPDSSYETTFEAAGVDGEIAEGGVLLSVVNRGGNKLDWFLDVEATMSVTADPAGDEVEVQARLRNQVAPGEPTYVQGPYPGSGLERGQYLGVATLTVPRYATELRVDGGTALVQGPDGDHQVVGVRVVVDPGGAAEVVFRYRLPPGVHAMEVVSAARPQPTTWTFNDSDGATAASWDDFTNRVVSWSP